MILGKGQRDVSKFQDTKMLRFIKCILLIYDFLVCGVTKSHI